MKTMMTNVPLARRVWGRHAGSVCARVSRADPAGAAAGTDRGAEGRCLVPCLASLALLLRRVLRRLKLGRDEQRVPLVLRDESAGATQLVHRPAQPAGIQLVEALQQLQALLHPGCIPSRPGFGEQSGRQGRQQRGVLAGEEGRQPSRQLRWQLPQAHQSASRARGMGRQSRALLQVAGQRQ